MVLSCGKAGTGCKDSSQQLHDTWDLSPWHLSWACRRSGMAGDRWEVEEEKRHSFNSWFSFVFHIYWHWVSPWSFLIPFTFSVVSVPSLVHLQYVGSMLVCTTLSGVTWPKLSLSCVTDFWSFHWCFPDTSLAFNLCWCLAIYHQWTCSRWHELKVENVP